MQAKMKRSQLFQMLHAVNSLAQVKGTCRFAYSIAKNKKLLTDETELMRDTVKPTPELIKFDEGRVELCKIHADKDEKGEPKTENGNFVGLTKNSVFEKALNEYREKNKAILDAQKKREDDFNKLLEEEIDFDFWEIKMSDIPDGVVGEQIEPLLPIINDGQEQIGLKKVE